MESGGPPPFFQVVVSDLLGPIKSVFENPPMKMYWWYIPHFQGHPHIAIPMHPHEISMISPVNTHHDIPHLFNPLCPYYSWFIPSIDCWLQHVVTYYNIYFDLYVDINATIPFKSP